MPFPKIIWQTYKDGNVPQPAAHCIRSWQELNPGWTHNFLDDEGIDNFIRENFSQREFDAFQSLPLSVMKADFWRYAVLLKHGGIYADIDTMCRMPIDTWPGQDKGMLVSVAYQRHICQWTIASNVGHPVMRGAVDLMVERISHGIDMVYEHFVHYYTGPMLFTDAIRTYLGADETNVPLDRWGFPDADRRVMTAERLCEAKILWADRDISIFPSNLFVQDAVQHINANDNWRHRNDYNSWMVLRDELNDKARRSANSRA